MEDLFENLPEDPSEAFVAFEKRARKEYLEDSIDDVSLDGWNMYLQSVSSFAHGFAEDFDRGELNGISSEHCNSYPDAKVRYALIQGAIGRIFAKKVRDQRNGLVVDVELSNEAKIEIRKLVEDIKRKIDDADIGASKKDSLLEKLNKSLFELDKKRTSLGYYLSAMIQIASATGKAAEELEPVVSKFERITKAIGLGSKEQKQLPKWEEQKRLPPPSE